MLIYIQFFLYAKSLHNVKTARFMRIYHGMGHRFPEFLFLFSWPVTLSLTHFITLFVLVDISLQVCCTVYST
jgi:hypothetical protein